VSTPIIALVVARAENGAIGRGGDLPWRLSTDLRQFRKVTMGKPIVMGSRTFESFGRPLDGRVNIVLSRDPDYSAPGAIVAPSLEAALDIARRSAEDTGAHEIMVIGGEELFRAVMPQASRIYLTEVQASPDADTWFSLGRTEWREVSREQHQPGPKDEHPFSFVVLERA
jgi:dihydrofolate reductase